MTLPDDAPPLTEAEESWPYAHRPIAVGQVLEIGDGLRMGLITVPDDSTARAQVYTPGQGSAAETATLRLGYPVACKGRTIRLLGVDRRGERPVIRVTVGRAG